VCCKKRTARALHLRPPRDAKATGRENNSPLGYARSSHDAKLTPYIERCRSGRNRSSHHADQLSSLQTAMKHVTMMRTASTRCRLRISAAVSAAAAALLVMEVLTPAPALAVVVASTSWMMCGMKRMESGRLQNTAPMRATTLDSCRRRYSASCERRERHRRLRDRVTCTTLRTLRWGRSRRVAQRKAERQRTAEAHKGACGERAMRTQDELAFFGFFDEGKGRLPLPRGRLPQGKASPARPY
jgi:hypothetical protein